MKDSVNVIGVQERRELSLLIKDRYQKVINDLQETAQRENSALVEKIGKKLGVQILKKEISILEKKIIFLKERITQLGFEDKYGSLNFTKRWADNESVIDYSSPAGKLYYVIVKARPDVRKLEDERNKTLQNIWLTNDRKSIKEIAERKISVKAIDFNKV